jgi:hypothetical protein
MGKRAIPMLSLAILLEALSALITPSTAAVVNPHVVDQPSSTPQNTSGSEAVLKSQPATPRLESRGTISIMVVGDSISQGFEGDWTWRYRLWEWFQTEGVAVNFVGPYVGTHPPTPTGPPSPPPILGSPPAPTALPDTSGGEAYFHTNFLFIPMRTETPGAAFKSRRDS